LFSLADYDYDLPTERIAQQPSEHRDRSRLLRLTRSGKRLSHHHFYDIVQFIQPGDVLVLNNTEVVPGRLIGRKSTGGQVELLILDYAEASRCSDRSGDIECTCLIKCSKKPKLGSEILLDHDLTARIVNIGEESYRVRFHSDRPFEEVLYRIGRMPLPPYIRRERPEKSECDDRRRYQTVYATRKGAVAAPTAGLHFTPDLLDRLRHKGVILGFITLHVGFGTFAPVRVDDIRAHRIHEEYFLISPETAAIVNSAKQDGKRVVAVGTTCVRTLEYAAGPDGMVSPGGGWCDLYIYPGFNFSVVDAMITNFHLPKSTLLMLVSAFAGRDRIVAAYREAVEQGYRFYSYGDAMLID
jgi:S-adenosylmethionine:tRNA ribosyltransferase-isomerase